MFDIGWSELLVIGVVALIAIGPKELPGVLRAVGQWMGKIRRMAAEFQGQFQEAMREAEMEDIKKQVDDLTSTATSVTNFDPLGDISKQFETAVEDKPVQVATPGEPTPPAATPDTPPGVEPAPQGAPSAGTSPEPSPEREPELAATPQPKAGSGA